MKTKKELRESYDQMKFQMGVFQIRNTVNQKIYIDSSITLTAAWNKNLMQLQFGSHMNKDLQKEWNEYGEDKFQFEIISELQHDDSKEIDYKKEVKELEKLFIEELKPFDDRGYNRKVVR